MSCCAVRAERFLRPINDLMFCLICPENIVVLLFWKNQLSSGQLWDAMRIILKDVSLESKISAIILLKLETRGTMIMLCD